MSLDLELKILIKYLTKWPRCSILLKVSQYWVFRYISMILKLTSQKWLSQEKKILCKLLIQDRNIYAQFKILMRSRRNWKKRKMMKLMINKLILMRSLDLLVKSCHQGSLWKCYGRLFEIYIYYKIYMYISF